MIEMLRVRVPAGAAGEFSSELILCADFYPVSFPRRVTAVARKRPRSFRQKCGWQVTPKHAYTIEWHTPLSQRSRGGLTMLSRHKVGTYKGSEITRNSSGNTQSEYLSTLSHSGLIMALKKLDWCARADLHLIKKKKCRQEINRQTYHHNPRKRG